MTNLDAGETPIQEGVAPPPTLTPGPTPRAEGRGRSHSSRVATSIENQRPARDAQRPRGPQQVGGHQAQNWSMATDPEQNPQPGRASELETTTKTGRRGTSSRPSSVAPALIPGRRSRWTSAKTTWPPFYQFLERPRCRRHKSWRFRQQSSRTPPLRGERRRARRAPQQILRLPWETLRLGMARMPRLRDVQGGASSACLGRVRGA